MRRGLRVLIVVIAMLLSGSSFPVGARDSNAEPSDFAVGSPVDQTPVSGVSRRPISVGGHDQKSFAYSLTPGRFTADQPMTSVLPSQVDEVDDNALQVARSLVVNNPDASGARGSSLQLAIWHVAAPADPRFALDATAQRMVHEVSSTGPVAAVVTPASQYDLGVAVTLKPDDHHLQSVDLRAVVRGRNGDPIGATTVLLERDDKPESARLTDDDGIAHFDSIPRPQNDQSDFVASAREAVPPGAVVRTAAGAYLIVAEGYQLQSTSRVVSEPRLDVTHLKTLITEQGVSALLSTGGILLIIALIVFIVAAFGLVAAALKKLRTRWAVLALTIGVVVSAIGIYAFNVDSTPPSKPGLTGEERAPGTVSLRVAKIAAQSTYPPNGCAGCGYEITKAIDGSLNTAWVSAPDVSQGQTIDIDLGQTEWVQSITIANGNQADAASYAGNGRVRVMEIFLDGGYYIRRDVPDPVAHNPYQKPGISEVRLPNPVLTQYLHINLARYTDNFYNVAISELGFRGYQPSREHAAVQQCTAVGYADPLDPC